MRHRAVVHASLVVCLMAGVALAQSMAKSSAQSSKMDTKVKSAAPAAAKVEVPANFDPKVARRVTADEVKKWLEEGNEIVVIDTRSRATGPVIKDALHYTKFNIEEWAKDKPKDTLVITYCTCPNEETSTRAVLKLQELGFTNSYALLGGLTAWTNAGLPTEERKTE